jgi:hypothetical protein
MVETGVYWGSDQHCYHHAIMKHSNGTPLTPPAITTTNHHHRHHHYHHRYHHHHQAAARIGCEANNLGAAAGAFVAWSEALGFNNVSMVPTMLVQWTLGANLSTAVTFFRPPLTERGASYVNTVLRLQRCHATP